MIDASKVQWDEPTPFDPNKVKWDTPTASTQDRAQATAAGVNRFALSSLPGLPVDTALNLWDLGKAGYGALGKATGMLSTDQMPDLTDRSTVPGSSDWYAKKERNLGLSKTIDPNVPQDPLSQKLFAFGQGGAAALTGRPADAVKSFAMGGISQVLPQIVADHGGNESMQTLASLAPLAIPALAAKVTPAEPAAPPSPRSIAAAQAQANGYVFPPSEVNPSPGIISGALEKIGGKAATQQAASIKNQNITQEAVKRDFGIPENTPLTIDALKGVRSNAGQAYEAVKGTGTITPGASYDAALDAIVAPYQNAARGFPNAKPNPIIAEVDSLRSPAFDASSAVDKISELRDKSSAAYASGDKATGGALKSAADAIEGAIDSHVQGLGQPDLLQAYRDARTTIAKTYTAQNAINPVTGVIDANKLARALAKGKPLTGGMRDAAEAASVSPKSFGTAGGTPGLSALDAAAAAGSMVASTVHPSAAIGAGWPILRGAARAAMMSGPYQRLMVNPPGTPGLLSNWRDLLPDNNLGLLGAYTFPAKQ